MVLQFVFRQHIAELIVVGDIWLYVMCDLFKYNIIVHVLISSLFFIYSRLSSCVEALQSILYPFSWQHTLIPVLPTSLLDICLSPTPYIVGILRGRDATALPGPIEEVHCLICPLTRILRLCDTSQPHSVPRSSGCHVTLFGTWLRNYSLYLDLGCMGSTNWMFVMIWRQVYFMTKFGSERSVWRWGWPSFIKNMDCDSLLFSVVYFTIVSKCQT